MPTKIKFLSGILSALLFLFSFDVCAQTVVTGATEEKTRPSLFSANKDAIFHKGINEIYPVPQSQIDIANSGGAKMLTQNPGY